MQYLKVILNGVKNLIFKGKMWRAKTIELCGLSIMICVIAIALTSCPDNNIPTIRIATNLWTGYETLYLARSLGYYEQTSIKLTDYPSGSEEVKAYRNNEIEGAGLSIDQALNLAVTQEDFSIITIMDFSNGADVILAKPEFKNMQALKGKKIGVESTALGAFFLTRALEKNNMTAKDIEIVSLELNEHERAYKTGKIDAVVTFGPPRAKLLELGAKLVFDSSQIPGEIVDTLVVRKDIIKKYPQVIQTLVNGRFKALEYLKQHPQDAANRIAPRTKVKPEQILDAFKGMKQPDLKENQELLSQTNPILVTGMQKLVKVMVENKLLSKPVEPSTILDDSFVKKAQI
ncbi:MAG TPA: ABC transporter substrate-binding protein [Allocoleopsis sp.]